MDATVHSSRQSLDRARILFGLRRYTDADAEIRKLLALEPENSRGHMWLALNLVVRNERSLAPRPERVRNLEEALREADTAIRLDPTCAFYHAVRVEVLLALNRIKLAMASIGEALRLDPQAPLHYTLLARIHGRQRKWKEMLAAADEALKHTPDDVDALQQRIAALVGLRRLDDASRSVHHALARNPLDAATHAQWGWVWMARKKPKEAVPHFRESLRLDPTRASTRSGLITALLVSHRLCGFWALLYMGISGFSLFALLWLACNLPEVNRILTSVGHYFPPAPIIGALLLLFYAGSAWFAWTSSMFLNLLVRRDPLGRQALSESQVIGTNWAVACLATMGVCLAAAVLLGRMLPLLGAVGAMAMMMPIGALLRMREGRGRTWLTVYTAILGGAGAVGLTGELIGSAWTLYPASVFFLGWLAYPGIAFALIRSL